MRVLVGCEWSGRVRDAFRRLGHEAYSCDTERGMGDYAEFHIRGDIRTILDEGWDSGIFFPPCTFLTNAGNTHYHSRRQPGQKDAIEFVRTLWNAPIPRIAIENPVGVLSTQFRKPDQYIQPCYFGDPFWKKTCLWLKNLPLLKPTKMCRADAKPWVSSGWNGPGIRDPKRRGITFQGIADAMAQQWGIDSVYIP